jgi:hypothetical protein
MPDKYFYLSGTLERRGLLRPLFDGFGMAVLVARLGVVRDSREAKLSFVFSPLHRILDHVRLSAFALLLAITSVCLIHIFAFLLVSDCSHDFFVLPLASRHILGSFLDFIVSHQTVNYLS